MKLAVFAALFAGTVFGQTVQTVAIPMRDGVMLAADVYGIEAARRLPVLLVRTPYNKKGLKVQAEWYARHEYVVVIQDCRGRYASKGDYVPYNNDRQDGFDTLEWIHRQSWSNGHAGMFGGSHTGLVQWLALADHPPGLDVIAPAFTASSLYGIAYRDQALRFALISTGGVRANPPTTGVPDSFDLLHNRLPLMHLPLALLEEGYGWPLPWMTSLLQHPARGGFWRQTSGTEQIGNNNVPVQLVTGYYDLFHHDAMQDYFRLRARSRRTPAQLVMGPWTHGGSDRSRVETMDFGSAAAIDLQATNLHWFDRFLKPGQQPTGAAVQYFIFGDNKWGQASQWPPAEAKPLTLWLHSNGRASFSKPVANEQPTVFASDPADPVPSVPPDRRDHISRVALWSPVDYTAISARPDVSSFLTEPLKQELFIAGPLEASLWAEADTPSADWVVRMFAIPASGAPIPLAQGIARDHKGPAARAHLVKVDLGSFGARLRPGYRIRIEISGSSFPMYDRNLHTGEGPFSGRMLKATQKLYYRPGAASGISLNLMPDGSSNGALHAPQKAKRSAN